MAKTTAKPARARPSPLERENTQLKRLLDQARSDSRYAWDKARDIERQLKALREAIHGAAAQMRGVADLADVAAGPIAPAAGVRRPYAFDDDVPF